MKKEDKQLLLKYLCAAFPYNVIIEYNNDGCSSTREMGFGSLHDFVYDNAELKPYLRPMSSMTGSEMLEYLSLEESIVAADDITYYFETYESIDWLLKNHFDFRNLIDKGLAIEVTESNNPYKE